MDTPSQIETFLADVDKLDTLEAKVAALIPAVKQAGEANVALQAANDRLTADLEAVKKDLATEQENYDKLEEESTTEIERLSQELSFATSTQGKANLSVSIGGKKYITPAGRKYNIGGKEVAVEDLVKDEEACAALISKNSGIFKPVTTE